ncbi:cupredoxin domain-containing protein [Candidatus Gottesmanbacteria bacterium]|nr:cupredoxin domain-containing protein [Candidatus Gottesmanbacteria bacterium]
MVVQYKNAFLLAGIVIVTIVIGIARRGGLQSVLAQKVSQGTQTITLTEAGFEPATVTITQGTTVTFKTTRGDAFWPASDLHPTHDIYPEFDPKEPTDANKTWSFKFDKVGTWKYHDHLFPYYRGTITVTKPQ